MVGGKVIGLARTPTGTLLHVQDNWDYCSIRVIEKKIEGGDSIQINLGDSIWWQCGQAMWTPSPGKAVGRQGVDFDVRISKLGYSH